MTPRLSVTPDTALIDEELSIYLEGLDPGDRVSLIAEFEVLWGVFRGEATFEADETGQIDLSEDAPIDGDYEGVQSMGLVQFAQLTEWISTVQQKLNLFKSKTGGSPPWPVAHSLNSLFLSPQ